MFITRNLFYLKISNDVVLPLYVYLDQQHVHWMSDHVLQHVLRDLKPLIGPKIALEGDDLFHLGTKNPKATVEVVRGETYQFAFFFRKMEQHSVLIKSRNFRMVPRPPAPGPGEPRDSLPNAAPVKTGRAGAKRGKKRARPIDSDEDIDEIEMVDSQQTSKPRITRRKIRKVYKEDDGMSGSEGDDSGPEDDPEYAPEDTCGDVYVVEGASGAVKAEEEEIQLPPSSAMDIFPINVDEEDKPKMSMTLSYRGHQIPGRYLCVIVEPYPPLSPEHTSRPDPVLPPEEQFRLEFAIPRLRDPSEVPSSSRAGSVRFRSETPLFLPEDDDGESIRGSPPRTVRNRVLPPVPSFDGSAKPHPVHKGKENAGGLLAFSQALTNVRHEEEGGDSDEDYLRGDADEDQRVLE